jgi:cytoskeletal protein CcmA (bactofilin family)
MFKRGSEGRSGELDTLVGARTILEGNLESERTVRVDGQVTGDVNARGDVFVGAEANISGNVQGQNVYLSGTVKGNVLSDGIVRLYSSARLHGNIQARGLIADEGGVFHGKCNIVEGPAATPAKRGAETPGGRVTGANEDEETEQAPKPAARQSTAEKPNG